MGNCPKCLRGSKGDDSERLNQETNVSGLTDSGEDNAAYASCTEPHGQVGDGPTRPSPRTSTLSTRKLINVPAREFFRSGSSFEDPNDDSDEQSHVTQDRGQSMISSCETVVLGNLQVYPQEKEALARTYDKTLCELKTEVQAQKFRHDLKMTELEQERKYMRLKHDNAMQDVAQREARRRCEHDQTLDDLRQKEKRLQAEYESDKQKLQKKMRDIEETHKEKLEQLDKKVLELTKKEQLITQKEQELERTREEERGRIVREHTAEMNELRREKLALEDNYKKKVNELEKRISLLQREGEEKDKVIARECEEKEAAHKSQIEKLRDKREKEVEEYMAKTGDLADNYQRLIHKQVELASQQRERDGQRQTEKDNTRIELAHKEHIIRIREKQISHLTAKEEARPSYLSQSQPSVEAQGKPDKLDPEELELTTKEELFTDKKTDFEHARKEESGQMIRELKANIDELENGIKALEKYYKKIGFMFLLFLALVWFVFFKTAISTVCSTV